jgi:hypothetical protein
VGKAVSLPSKVEVIALAINARANEQFFDRIYVS